MSDIKRNQLLPINDDITENGSDENKCDEINSMVLKSERFHLKLTESTEDSYPEFNIADLMHARLREKSNDIHGFSDNEDNEVKRLAKKFEKKYGPNSYNYYYGKKSNWKNDDYADIGAGYDESDSFIDNTEAYDEIIPENVSTFYGGFYVNYGPLEFKQLNYGNKSSRKRLMTDSDSSDVETNKKQNNTVTKKTQLKNDENKSVQKKVDNKKGNNVKNSTNVKRTKTEKSKAFENISSDGSSLESLSESSEENRFSTTTIDSDYSLETDWNDELNSFNLPKELKKIVLELLSHKKEINKQTEDAKKYQIIDKYLSLMHEQSGSLSMDNSNKLYNKISDWLKIPKIDMIKYSKKSNLLTESEKLNQIIQKLKQNINEIMPKCELQYNTEYNRSLNINDLGEKNVKQPKRKFIWNAQTTKLLNEIVDIKRKEYNSSGTHKEGFYCYIIPYFKTEIINLWPKDWMGINAILKHCKNLSDKSTKQNCPPSSIILNKSQNTSIMGSKKIEINENSSIKQPQQLDNINIPTSTEITNICTPQKHKSVIVSSSAVTKLKLPLSSSTCSTIDVINSTSDTSSVVSHSKPSISTSFIKFKPSSTIIRTVASTMTTSTTTITSIPKKPMEIFPITSTPIPKQPKSFLPRISIEIQPSIVNNTTTSVPVAKLINTSSTQSFSSSNTSQISSSNNLPQTSPLDCRLKREVSTLHLPISKEYTNILINSSNNKKPKIVNKIGVNNNSKYGTEASYMPSTSQTNWIPHSSQHNYQMKSQAIANNFKNTIMRNESQKNLNDEFQLLMNNLKELEQMQISNSTTSVTASSSRLHKPVPTATTTSTITTQTNKHPLLNEQLHQHSNQYSVININHNSSFSDLFLQNTSQQSTNSRSSNQKVICDSSSINNQAIYPTAFLAQKNQNKNSSSFIISNLLSTTQSKPLDER